MSFDFAFRDAHRISPSQIESARLCLRRWGLEKLDGLPKKSNKYADRGTDAHSALEVWQRDGVPIDLTTDIGKIVSAGLKFLPQPGSHKTEHNFVFDSGNVVYHGLMDLRGKVSFRIQTVWDHKTTSSLRWMKLPVVLRRDPQANIYAMAAIEECKKEGYVFGHDIDRVEQNWVYYLANPEAPKSRKVQLHVLPTGSKHVPLCPPEVKKEHFGVMYFDELQERFSEIEETGKELLQLYHDKPPAMELPYNAAACGAFGGCPYKDNPCKLTISERIMSMEEQTQAKKISLADRMAQKLAKEGEQPPPKTPAAKAAPAPAATSTAADSRQQELPAVNPPEQKHGVDPDAPAGTKAADGSVVGYGRTEIAALAMQGLVAARVYSTEDNRYPVKVATEAVQLADALLAALAK